MQKLGIYIDFENFYYSCLDLIENILYKDSNKDSEENTIIIQEIEKILDNFLEAVVAKDKFRHSNLSFVKIFGNLNNLPFIENERPIVDLLRDKFFEIKNSLLGWENKNRKNSTDMALFSAVATDLKNSNINTVIIVSGDIDYLELFNFIAKNYNVEYNLLSFKNSFNPKYESVLYMKNSIIFMDDLLKLKINSEDAKFNKYLKIFDKTKNDKEKFKRELEKTYLNFSEPLYIKLINQNKNEDEIFIDKIIELIDTGIENSLDKKLFFSTIGRKIKELDSEKYEKNFKSKFNKNLEFFIDKNRLKYKISSDKNNKFLE